jgi:hypothetical protein
LGIEWYFKKDGRELGPVDSGEVRKLAKLGVLRPTDLVRKSDMTRWAPASAIKGLFASPRPAKEPRPINSSMLADQLVSAIQPVVMTKPVEPIIVPEPPVRKLDKGIWVVMAVAVVVATAGGVYRFVIEPGHEQAALADQIVSRSAPTTAPPVLSTDGLDPQLQAITTQSPFDRGLALQHLRGESLSPKSKSQARQLIGETLDDREYETIWPAALRALGEVGSSGDLPRLKPLIESGPVQTQSAAIATAMLLDPQHGLAFFEPRVNDNKYASAITTCLADFGSRCEPAALAMLRSKQKLCRYHALNLLKQFGSAHSIDAITKAKQNESDKSILQGYQFTIDAINARSQ